MSDVFQWIIAHYAVILGAAGALAAAFVAVAKLSSSFLDGVSFATATKAAAVQVVSTITNILVPKTSAAPAHTETTVTSTIKPEEPKS